MTKWLVTITRENVLFRKVSKSNRGLAIANERLYRIDDEVCFTSISSPDCIASYDIDEQQPWGNGKWIDPDRTKTLIDSLKLRQGKIHKNSDWNWNAISLVIVAVIVGWAILSQVMSGEMHLW